MSSKIKLLLVEDEVTLGQIVSESLETRDFEVIYCTNGETGWQAYQEHQPAICVLDIMMPRRDGFSLARAIRADNPLVPIIFLTARSQTADVLQGFEAGANDYIKKPFSMEELIVRIRALLRHTHLLLHHQAEPDNAIWNIGNYVFDYTRQLLTIQEQSRKLTHREAEILRLLYLHRNRVLERKAVLQQLWGDDSFFNARSMDVFITKLRKYLQADVRIEIINVRGVGYKLVIG